MWDLNEMGKHLFEICAGALSAILSWVMWKKKRDMCILDEIKKEQIVMKINQAVTNEKLDNMAEDIKEIKEYYATEKSRPNQTQKTKKRL